MESPGLLRTCFALSACFVLVLSSAPVAAETDETSAIRQRIDDYLDAWNRGDAEALAAFYDQDYDWMNPLGMHLYGRDTVVAYQAASFKRALPPGVTHSLEYDVLSIRLITDDVAVVDIKYTGTGMGLHPEKPVQAMIVSIYVKKDGTWLRAAQRNFALLHPAN